MTMESEGYTDGDESGNASHAKRQKVKASSVERNGHLVFDLRPNRFLLDPNFSGYKLSLDSLPIYSKVLENVVDYAKPTAHQYSLQHVKLQLFSNHVFPDLWNTNSVYFVDADWNVLTCSIKNQERCLTDIQKVWKIPGCDNKLNGRFNVTLMFPSENLTVLSDGCGNLFILNTGNRANLDEPKSEWQVELHSSLFSTRKNPQFVLLDAQLYLQGEQNNTCLDVLSVRIDEKSEWTDFFKDPTGDLFEKSESAFVTLVEWLSFEEGNGQDSKWNLKSSRSLLSHHGLHYASIEENGTGIYAASDDIFQFAHDSEQPVISKPRLEAVQRKKDYIWSQTADEVTIWFKLPEGAKKNDLQVVVEPQSLKIEYQSHQMLAGDLFHIVKADEVVWTLENEKLEIVLAKVEQNLMWSNLLPGNENGEEIVDPESLAEIHSRLAHLCCDQWGADAHRTVFSVEEMEECDELPIDSSIFMRLDRKLQKITNQASLGSHQWLFNVRTDPKSIPCICLRHDVDAIVWRPNLSNSGDSLPDFQCKHVGTFLALGYIQASKEQRKFTVSSPDLSYAAICDSTKHIHVYRQPSPVESDLRNRKTGEKVSHISKQQVISIDPPDELLGSYAGNQFLFVLTSKNIHAVQMKAVEIG